MSSPPPAPEYDLVRLLARAEVDGDRVCHWAEEHGEVDWQKVVRLGAYHRLLPLLWVHLGKYGEEWVPENVLQALRQNSLAGAVRVLFLASEMATIARGLKEDGVPFLILKGPTLAEAYGSMAHRPFVDNDVLVRRADFPRLEQTLLRTGFQRLKRSDWQLRGYLFVHGEYTFGRSVGTRVSTVDVHTNVAPRGYSYDGTYDTLSKRSREITVGGEVMQALGWADLFITLCVNALKDQWNRLRLAADLAEVAVLVEDWEEAEAVARAARSLRAFRIGVLVATEQVGATFPPDVVARARADAKAVSLSQAVGSHLRTFHEERIMSGGDRARLVLQAQDDLWGQAQYLGYVVLRRLSERFVSPHPRAPKAEEE